MIRRVDMSLSKFLFETEALKVSSYDRPFFYTSGKLGPFYVNTHFLYGSDKEANGLLNKIDRLLILNRGSIPEELTLRTYDQYISNEIYRNVIDELINKIKNTVDIDKVEYISGGERRDWFFSFIVTKILNKKHITIFKDKKTLITDQEYNIEEKLNGNVIHVVDLITIASSFENYWIPAISELSNNIDSVFSIVDRDQGGLEYFLTKNIKFYSLIKIDKHFFEEAENQNLISFDQNDLIRKYLNDPDNTMRNFLKRNPDFINKVLNENSKDSKKARLLIDKNIYGGE